MPKRSEEGLARSKKELALTIGRGNSYSKTTEARNESVIDAYSEYRDSWNPNRSVKNENKYKIL